MMARISHLVASVKLDFFAAGELSSLELHSVSFVGYASCLSSYILFAFIFFGFKEANRALYSETRLFAVTISSQSRNRKHVSWKTCIMVEIENMYHDSIEEHQWKFGGMRNAIGEGHWDVPNRIPKYPKTSMRM